jgi:hypothetical protein
MNSPDNTAAATHEVDTSTAGLLPKPAGEGAGRSVAQLVEQLGLADVAVVHAGCAQVQGDVLVLPWPTGEAPTALAHAKRTARPIPRHGWAVTRGRHPHSLIPDGPGVQVAPDSVGTALGVLLVDAGSVAVLGHHEHADLRIGEGAYILRRQRRYTPEQPETPTVTEYVED